ncbi:MAG: ABC transporter ATP-binding protein [Clostridia bacterium]|nr:ABC transporter ATP-binding protein [Clostridia bacterium]
MLKKLFPFVKGYRLTSILSPVVITVEVVLEVFIPLLMADIIDVGIPAGDFGYVLKKGGLMIVMCLGALVAGALAARLAIYSSNGAAKNLRMSVFEKIQSFSFKNTDKYSTASLLTRLTNDITNIQSCFQMLLRMLTRSPMMLIMATVFAIRISPQLSMILFLAIPFLGLTMFLLARAAFPRFERMLKQYDGMNARTQETLIAIRVVKAFVRGDYETERFEDSAAALKKAQRAAESLMIVSSPVMQLTVYSCIIAAIWIGGGHVLNGTLTSGALMSFITYITQILMSLMMMTFAFINFVISSASAKRICEVLDEVPAIRDNDAATELLPEDGSVEFRDVSFSYSDNPENPTLEHISLSVRSGEVIGIVGGSGSGKTTLVQLIPRLYDVLSGSVLVGGHDVRDYKTDNLRAAIGMVLQKNVLFSGTIRENLLWGKADATQEEIDAACRAACAYDFIQSFPDKYETDLGQGGVNVSGGQKQRLCIARALIKQPKVLILDDSTSACDTATDANIRRAFREELAGTTKIIIAQRVASVMDADRIVVLDDGKIDAIGTHAELLETNEIYREIYSSQQKGVA